MQRVSHASLDLTSRKRVASRFYATPRLNDAPEILMGYIWIQLNYIFRFTNKVSNAKELRRKYALYFSAFASCEEPEIFFACKATLDLGERCELS